LLNVLSLAVLLTAGQSSHADTFGSGDYTFSIDFISIGSAGNPDASSVFFGGVKYDYRIGITELPQDAVTKATNLGLANVTAGAWAGSNQPAGNLTWYEAAAFVNWLNTSTGHQAAYNLNGTATALTLWDSSVAWDNDPGAGVELNLYRHQNAVYFLPSDDEWFKAAYHKNDGVTGNYWNYATASDTVPTAVAGGTLPGTVVYNGVGTGPADVDNSGGLSAWGTRGQTGNAWEWQESASDGVNDSPSEFRKLRSGSWSNPNPAVLASTYYFANDPTASGGNGMRVASVEIVPEPTTTSLILGVLAAAMLGRRRRGRSS
jgi:hypothetical protein